MLTDLLAMNDLATGNSKGLGPDHAKIAKLDRDNDVAPPTTVTMELGKVLQQARQNHKDAEGKPKPLSQGDLAKMINQTAKVVQECTFQMFVSDSSFILLSRVDTKLIYFIMME
jgi:hypothetical protein